MTLRGRMRTQLSLRMKRYQKMAGKGKAFIFTRDCSLLTNQTAISKISNSNTKVITSLPLPVEEPEASHHTTAQDDLHLMFQYVALFIIIKSSHLLYVTVARAPFLRLRPPHLLSFTLYEHFALFKHFSRLPPSLLL